MHASAHVSRRAHAYAQVRTLHNHVPAPVLLQSTDVCCRCAGTYSLLFCTIFLMPLRGHSVQVEIAGQGLHLKPCGGVFRLEGLLASVTEGGDGREASGARARASSARALGPRRRALERGPGTGRAGRGEALLSVSLPFGNLGGSIFHILHRGLYHSRCLLILFSIAAAGVFCYLATVAFRVSEGQIKIFEAPCKDRS